MHASSSGIGIYFLGFNKSLKASVADGTYRLESEFDAVSYPTSSVAIVPSDYSGLSNPISRNINPSVEQIEDMVRKAIELQGGLSGIINPGNTVMIKINLVGGFSGSGDGENTDYRVVKALVKIIHEHTEGNVEILIAEGTARSNDDPDVKGSVWENGGYVDLSTESDMNEIDFDLLILNQSYNDLEDINLGDDATAAPHNRIYWVHEEQVNADVYISVPVLKIHDTGITNALKKSNWYNPGMLLWI